MIAALFLMASQGAYKGDIQVLTPVTALLLGGTGVALYYLDVSESWSYVVFMSVCVGYFVWTNRMVRWG